MLLAVATARLRARNKARTREEIVDAALTLFESQGYDKTTCEDIAAAAGIAARTFFRYFEAKADVLAVGRTDEAGPLAALAELRQRPATEGPTEVLLHALAHPVSVLEAQRDWVVRQVRVIMSTPSLDELRREPYHRFEAPFAEALALRLDRPADDLRVRWLAAAAATSLRLSIERWVAAGAPAGGLLPLVEEALALVREGVQGRPASGPGRR